MEEEKTTLIDAINSAFRRRKYYLNSKVKRFTGLSSRKKSIDIPVGMEHELTGMQRKYINELISNYGYSSQMSIPTKNK